jgi:hypothetical protein
VTWLLVVNALIAALVAAHHGCRLATLDAGIPKAFVIPE